MEGDRGVPRKREPMFGTEGRTRGLWWDDLESTAGIPRDEPPALPGTPASGRREHPVRNDAECDRRVCSRAAVQSLPSTPRGERGWCLERHQVRRADLRAWNPPRWVSSIAAAPRRSPRARRHSVEEPGCRRSGREAGVRRRRLRCALVTDEADTLIRRPARQYARAGVLGDNRHFPKTLLASTSSAAFAGTRCSRTRDGVECECSNSPISGPMTTTLA